MKLLFITQKIYAGDDLLGVYHEWVRRLAMQRTDGGALQFEKIHVIALTVGDYALPHNVVVHSLGKEVKRSPACACLLGRQAPACVSADRPRACLCGGRRAGRRIQYVARFFTYIWQFRNEYDTIFVHMNTEYVLLGWWFWKLLGKRAVLWFAHYRPDWKLRFADKVVDTILTSVPEACAIHSKKIVAIGQAIDTDVFRNTDARREKKSLLFLGRIAPVKKIEILIDAFAEIKKSFSDAVLRIVGEPGEKDAAYNESIIKRIDELNCAEDITFRGKVSNTETPAVYNQYEIFVNLTPTGSFDKTILEAMACETVVVVSNRAYEHILPDDLQKLLLFRENDTQDLAQKLKIILALSSEEKKKIGARLRECVVDGHSMEHLISKLSEVLKME